MWPQPLWGGASYSNIVFEDGTNNIISGTVNPTAAAGHQTGLPGRDQADTDTYQFAVGGRYDAGPLVITGDLARTSSKFTLRAESVDYELNTNDFTVDWYTGRPGGTGPTFEVVGLDFSDPANYNYRGFFERYLVAKGDDWQARLDAEYEPAGLDWLPEDPRRHPLCDPRCEPTPTASVTGTRKRRPFQIPISAVPLDYALFHSAFHGDNHAPSPVTWLAPTFQQCLEQS